MTLLQPTMYLRKMGQLQPRPISRLLASQTTQLSNKTSPQISGISTTSFYCCCYESNPKTKRGLGEPRPETHQNQLIPPHQRRSNHARALFLQLCQHQIRAFQTCSKRLVTARNPRTNTFSESTASAIPRTKAAGVFQGHKLDVLSPSPENLNSHEVCRQLQHEEFSDHRVAFSSKTMFELARSSFFFFIFQYRLFTDRSEEFMRLMKTVLGERLSEQILKKMIYEQYVAGETTQEVQSAVNRLQKEGISPLIAVPIEDDLGHTPGSNFDYEALLNKNCEKTLKCLDLTKDVGGTDPMIQIRVTALMYPELIKTLGEACAVNENGEEDAISMAAIQTLLQGIRGETMEFPQTKEWEKVAAHKDELLAVLNRVRQITEKIRETGVVTMVDAEYTYFGPAIRHITFAMMEICNKDKPLVFYTYQAYLKKGYKYLTSDLELAKRRGICFALKLVRGAYIIKERKRAALLGYPDPINETYDDTSKNYRRCVDALMEAASENEGRVRFVVASHNEDSVRYAFERMGSLGLPVDSKSVLFAQLYGMADHVSFTLGQKGCNIVKSIPYGSVEDTIPYLARRAHENRSIFDNVRKEKQMVKRAMCDRLLRRN